MITRSTLLHLRFPFSFFLLPVYLFALSLSIENTPSLLNVLLSFFILHYLLYPASNGYNSYFDKDEGSIGTLKSPPKVSINLYYTSILMDVFAIVLGLYISLTFSIMLFVYGVISKAYSHPSVRLKRLPVFGWFIVGLFQGLFTFQMVYAGINVTGFEELFQSDILIPGLLTSLMLWGSYPMTQIYQHEEDLSRGDITLSLRLGILGTFHFTIVAFSIAIFSFLYYFYLEYNLQISMLFAVLLSPVLVYFLSWYVKVRRDRDCADFQHTMRLNIISSTMLVLFFALLTCFNYYGYFLN